MASKRLCKWLIAFDTPAILNNSLEQWLCHGGTGIVGAGPPLPAKVNYLFRPYLMMRKCYDWGEGPLTKC